jgi:ABC-type uncharacterized transport system involved in gliding motility auxiliary subunit
MATQERKRKVAAQTGLYLVVVAAIVVVVNLLSVETYGRIDATENERYTLSKGSARLVKNLKQPVHVDVYIKTGLAQLDAFVRDLTDLMKEYERAGGKNFKFSLIEPKTDEQREKAKEEGLQDVTFGEASATGEDQASVAQGYLGLVFKYGSEKAVIPQLQPSRGEGLEFWITNKIREIRDKNDKIQHRIGVVTGKDELKLDDTNLVPRQGKGGSPSLKSILEQAFPFYKVEELDLKEGESEIEKDFAGVIITQPRKEYTDKELRRIDEFLMKGDKSLVVFASAVTMKPNDATMQAELDTHGLEKLLTGYGINMKKDAVFDYGAQFRLPVMTGMGGMAWIRHPAIAHVVDDPRFEGKEMLLDTTFPGFFRMEELMVPFPSSLELMPDKQPKGVKVYAVARTTPASAVDDSASVDMKLREEWLPKGKQEQRVIAAVSEGSLRSAFHGSPGGDIKPNESAPSPSRVLVVSSSEFITNPFAYAGNGPELGGQFQMFGAVGGDQQLQMFAGPYAQKYLTATIIAFKNILDWMSGDQDLIAASAKILGEPNLTYASIEKPKFSEKDDEAALKKKDEEYRNQRKDYQRRVQWTLIAGVPVLFAGIGLFRWRRRESLRSAVGGGKA